jgi:hypothetical protein
VVGAVDDTSNGTGPLTVDCGFGRHATGGGVTQRGNFDVSDHLIASFPSLADGTPVDNQSVNPRYWTTRYEAHDGGAQDGWFVVALCTPNP